MRKLMCVLLITAGIGFAGAQEEEAKSPDKVKVSIEFESSLISVGIDKPEEGDSKVIVDSMTDAGFNDDETKLEFSYESELWGAVASLKFGNENLRIFIAEGAEMLGGSPLSIGDLYAWVKPFGEHFKFTGGIFENNDGVADYTDDIDDFAMGVFIGGEDDDPFSEPEEITNTKLTSGFLAEASFGPVTAQLLLAPNYSKESAAVMFSDFLGIDPPAWDELSGRFFRIGGRIIGDIPNIGTVSAMIKAFQYPVEVLDIMEKAERDIPLDDPPLFGGSKADFMTFGAYFDLTAIENLGVSLGYTGFLPYSDADGVDSILWNGIDLRAMYTGIEGLSLSTHHNISFAFGAEHEWMGMLGKDCTFFNLYNAIGGTKELTEKFSVNAEIGNVLSMTDYGDADKVTVDNFFVKAKLITKVSENAEFNVGLVFDLETRSGTEDSDYLAAVFSIPVGIKVSF